MQFVLIWNTFKYRDHVPRGQKNLQFVHRNNKKGGGHLMAIVGAIGDGTQLPLYVVEGNLEQGQYLWYLSE